MTEKKCFGGTKRQSEHNLVSLHAEIKLYITQGFFWGWGKEKFRGSNGVSRKNNHGDAQSALGAVQCGGRGLQGEFQKVRGAFLGWRGLWKSGYKSLFSWAFWPLNLTSRKHLTDKHFPSWMCYNPVKFGCHSTTENKGKFQEAGG